MTFDDDDRAPATPARKAQARKPRAAGPSARRKSRRRRVDMNKIARFAGIGITAALGVGIVVNALMMQTGHHPAPLFGSHAVLTAAAPAPAPQPHASAAAASVPAAAPARPVREAPAAPPVVGDPIGQLLRGGPPPAGDGTETRTVLGIQRALAKLGYTVKADGTLGPTTRKALQAFEKDHHLPVQGEPSRRLVKILSAESGVRVD